MPTDTVKLEISWWSIWRVVGIGALLWFLFQIQDILVILFLVFIFVAALNPIVTRMQKKVPRLLSVVVIYVILLALIIAAGSMFFTPLVEQVNTLARLVPAKVTSIMPFFERITEGKTLINQLTQGLQQFSGSLSNFSGSVVNTTFGIFGGIFTIVTVLVLTFYLLLEEKAARLFLANILPPVKKENAFMLINKIQVKMGAWVRGQILLMAIIAILDFIVLLAMGIPAPFALAIWCGLMEIVPFLGPILGAIPAIVVALVTGSAWHALILLLLFLLVQQLEGHIIVPKVMQRAVGISPVNVILALLIGGKLWGMTGALLAVPIAAIVAVLVTEWSTAVKALRG